MKAKLIFGYRGHGQRWGIIAFGNGYTIRLGSIALHLWRLSKNA